MLFKTFNYKTINLSLLFFYNINQHLWGNMIDFNMLLSEYASLGSHMALVFSTLHPAVIAGVKIFLFFYLLAALAYLINSYLMRILCGYSLFIYV